MALHTAPLDLTSTPAVTGLPLPRSTSPGGWCRCCSSCPTRSWSAMRSHSAQERCSTTSRTRTHRPRTPRGQRRALASGPARSTRNQTPADQPRATSHERTLSATHPAPVSCLAGRPWGRVGGRFRDRVRRQRVG